LKLAKIKVGFPVRDTQKFDEDFHLGFIISGSSNKWLRKLGNGVIDLIKLTTYLSINPKVAHKEHCEIITALMQHDLRRASKTLEDHIERSKKDAITALIQEEKRIANQNKGG